MTKHAPEKWTGEQLYNRIFDHEPIDDSHDWSMVMDDGLNPIEKAMDKVFVVRWPDCCVTTQHLGDATIELQQESEVER